MGYLGQRGPSTALLAIGLWGCSAGWHPAERPPEPETSPPAISEPAAPPVEARTELALLEVPGFEPAVVAVPSPITKPKPLLIATHGAGDTPTWQCRVWQQLIGARGFILCPAGVPFSRSRDTGYFYRNHHELEREVLASIAALGARYPGQIDTGAAVYTGYSQGATMGALMIPKHAAQFSRLVLIEGGHHEWNAPIAKKFRRGGGQRVLFACGVRYCKRGADVSARHLTAAGVEARVEYAEGAGHIYDGPVAERVFHAFSWLVAGDARWQE